MWWSSVATTCDCPPAAAGSRAIGMLRSHHQVSSGTRRSSDSPSCWATQPATTRVRFGCCVFAGPVAEVAVDLLFGVVPDGAGVVEHQIGIQLGRRLPIAHGLRDSRHPFGIRLVHLAAEGGDPVAAPLGLGSGVSGGGGGDQISGSSLLSVSHDGVVSVWRLTAGWRWAGPSRFSLTKAVPSRSARAPQLPWCDWSSGWSGMAGGPRRDRWI